MSKSAEVGNRPRTLGMSHCLLLADCYDKKLISVFDKQKIKKLCLVEAQVLELVRNARGLCLQFCFDSYRKGPRVSCIWRHSLDVNFL